MIEERYKKPFLCFKEVAAVIGCHPDTVPYYLHQSGITCRKVGTRKVVSVFDIASFLHSDRIAPIDNSGMGNRGRKAARG
jgi:hypothetical protein